MSVAQAVVKVYVVELLMRTCCTAIRNSMNDCSDGPVLSCESTGPGMGARCQQNTGYKITGNKNMGNENTGDMNTGDRNTGDENTGDENAGKREPTG